MRSSIIYEDADSYAPLARIEHGKDQQNIGQSQILRIHTDHLGTPLEAMNVEGTIT